MKATVVCTLMISWFAWSAFVMVTAWSPVDPKTAAKELVEVNKRMLKIDKFSFNITYSSFKEHLEKIPYETLHGYVVKDGKNNFSNINGVVTMQNNRIRIVVDSARRSIKISNPLEGPEPVLSVEEYIKSIGVCKEVKRKEENKLIGYRFEPKALKGIVAQEIYLDENFLNKTVIFYVNEHTTRQNNELIKQTVFPRLEISITDFKKLTKADSKLFNEKDFMEIDGEKVTLNSKYKNFKFFDGRYKK
jgi:hypothetical protein